MEADIASLKQQFEHLFGPGGKVHVVRAPGRVNLIGEHTDYNDGFVFPMAIEPEMRIACRMREDAAVRIASTLFPDQIVEFAVDQPINRGEPTWANYVRGVAAELLGAGIRLSGMDALVTNTLPMGGGLSSSAALEVSTALAFLAPAELKLDPMRLALICQKAEHEYALVPCGIMDQMLVVSARAGHATLYDCRNHTRQFVPIDANEARIVICNTMVSHELSGGEYAKRRRQCETAVEYFKKENPSITALRDVTMKQVEAAGGKLDDLILRRARHVVGENARTVEAATALGQRKYERAGELMVKSHASLRDDYEVSCRELDFLADEAMKVKGVYGARMTGGGFGGCIVALVQPRAAESLETHLTQAYGKQFNIKPTIFSTVPAAGASMVE